MIGVKAKKGELKEKILDVDASMQGEITFKDPVNLKINGTFEGKLNTRGVLIIGESAQIKADIAGDEITIAGRVDGNIVAQEGLKLAEQAKVFGEIQTPSLVVEKGALLYGNCKMISDEIPIQGNTTSRGRKNTLSAEEVARYLTIDSSVVVEWAESGKLPAINEDGQWRFERRGIDEWIQNEKVR